MKQKKRLLVSSFAMLLVSILTLTSVTYAWFTSGDAATVSGVQFHAEAQEGIQISVGAEDNWVWRSTVDADVLKKVAAHKSQLDAETLAPVSTTAGELAKGILYKGTVNDTSLNVQVAGKSEGEKTESGTTVTNAGYYAFDLYFKNEGSSPKTIYLDTTSAEGNKSTVTGIKDAEGNGDVGLQNATRVAFVVVGSADNATSLATSKVDAEHPSTEEVVIWEPNAKLHHNTVTSSYTIPNEKLAYYGVDAATSTESGKEVAWSLGSVSNGIQGLFKNGTAFTSTVSTNDGATDIELFDISANSTVKITIFIWIEGQDVDCINFASTGSVATGLRFVIG